MKNLMCTLLLINYSATFAQLENFATEKADTTYTASHQIKQIVFKSDSSATEGVANFIYYNNDTLKSINYKDVAGFADFGFNDRGDMNFIQFKHEAIGEQYSHYKYEYYESGRTSKWFNYDSTMTLIGTEEYSYNADGLMDIVLTQDENGDLTSYWLYEYDNQEEKTSIIGIVNPGIIKYKYYSASKSEDGQAFKCRYIYDSDDQYLKRLYVTKLKENGEPDGEEFAVKFETKGGKLKAYAYGTYGTLEKLKGKDKEEKWVKEFYIVSERNIEIQAKN